MGTQAAGRSVGASVVDASVRFGETLALDSITATFAPGQSTALVGPNGCGKTTLLRLLAGLVNASSGTVSVYHDATAFVVQHRNAHGWMPLTVREVIRMGRYGRTGLFGLINAEDRKQIERAAEAMEVQDILGAQFGDLSGGQQQRAIIAQALAQAPTLLLLDEPITGLDLASQERILELIEEETARGTTVVLSTHHLDEARHCDQVLLMAGRVIAQGPPDATLTPEWLRAAYGERFLGSHDDHDHTSAMLILDDHGHGH